jgi:RNA polymerase sigma factor (sigma-70 family)
MLEENLPWIKRAADSLCRRNGVIDADAEDFHSYALLRLIDNDYAVLRKFQVKSKITTYLTVVLAMFFQDWLISRWGRWRSSAAAKREGPVAVMLEQLIYRDGYKLEQAARILRARRVTTATDRELAVLLSRLPVRSGTRPREVGPEPLEATPAAETADQGVRQAEDEAERQTAIAALERVVDALPPEDCTIVRMHFWEGSSVADIARALGLEQKPLYRRLERILKSLGEALEKAGISREQIRSLLDEDAE